jgi:putative sigma-54 modulation protein
METHMQLTISGHHLAITAPIREYATNKLEKLERHHKLLQKADATIHISGGELFAATEHEDLYAAIDLLAEKLDRQLIKHKEKHRKR